VGLIPGLVDRRIAQAVIGGQIDDPLAGGQQIGNDGHGRLMRQRRKNEVGLTDDEIRIHRIEAQRDAFQQGGKHLGDGGPGMLAGGDAGDLDPGMIEQQTNQFDAGITAGSDNGYLEHEFLPECRKGKPAGFPFPLS